MPLAERDLIQRIRQRAGQKKGLAAISDDCAILRIPADCQALVTTDFSLEGVHFTRRWQPAKSIGHRCLLRGLSDIAAMGGDPLAVFLSLALPASLSQRWVDEFLDGLLRLASKFGVMLAGGDTARSPKQILADIVVIGTVPKGKAILRSGARPGDRIFVTGALGGSSATASKLQRRAGKNLTAGELNNYFYPTPRIDIGRLLRKKAMASSMIDVSDGLSTDLNHICEESGVGAEIVSEAIPISRMGKRQQRVSLESALHGGEDYELLFTASAETKIPDRLFEIPVTEIGQVVRKKGVFLKTRDSARKLPSGGWEHFASR